MSTFSILTVCSGNICRSPMAEQLLRAQLAGYPGVNIRSAGTLALVGEGMDSRSAEMAGRFGSTDTQRHIAAKIDVDQVKSSDFVLAMSREHRRAVVELVPRAARVTFTVREFARLASAVTDLDLEAAALMHRSNISGRLREAVEAAACLRGLVSPPVSPDDDDVVDPYRRDYPVYEESANQLVPAVQAVVDLFHRALSVAAT